MLLRSGFLFVAQRLQEAADAVSHSVARSHLQDAIQDAHRGSGNWGSYVDHTGDGKEGDVIYSSGGDTMSAPYSITSSGSKQTAAVDTAKAQKVIPVVSYKKQVTSTSESASATETNVTGGAVKLCESATTLETITVREAKADYEIKLIAPGKGSSAFYPAEVLKRDGPGVFKAGTHVYVNHPTLAEEAARPEGDVKNLAGVLTTDAVYHESHAKGPGLYGRMKVFADHGQMVEEKAPHVGMSIRAGGIAESGKTRDGLPILKELTHAESVDIVTRAGAGGMILTESAAGAQTQEVVAMTAEEAKVEAKKQVDLAVAEAVKPLRERAIRADARDEAVSVLKDVTLPQEAKTRIVERAVATLPLNDKGELDASKFRETVVAEAKSEGEYLAKVTGSGRVFGNGSSAGFSETKPDKKALKEARKEQEEEMEHAVSVYQRLGLSEAGAKAAAKGRVA